MERYRLRWTIFILVISVATLAAAEVGGSEDEVRKTVTAFQLGLQNRDLNAIERLVSPGLIVFENGERNDGWTDFRDNHLIPEMKEPAPKSKWEIIKVRAGSDMAWAYTHETFTTNSGSPLVLWSFFILEKKPTGWKIVALNWSVGRVKEE